MGNTFTLSMSIMLCFLSELLRFDRESREGHTDSGQLQDERTPIFSPALRPKKSDLVDFVKLNNHGNLLFVP